jgi:hypothetical protein
MGRHVETVSQQRHRTVDEAGDDLDDHHGRRQADDPQCAPFTGFYDILAKGVSMGAVIGVSCLAGVLFHRRIKSPLVPDNQAV